MSVNITVSFGLLSVACKSDSAIEKAPEPVNLCHGQPGEAEHPHKPLKRPAMCGECGKITDYSVLDKGFPDGASYRIVTQEDLADLKEEHVAQYRRSLNLIPHPAVDFLSATAQADSVNYLTPKDSSVARHYAALVKLIGEHPERAFVSMHTPKSVTSLYRVTVREGVLVMEKRTRETSLKPVPAVGLPDVDAKFYAALEGILPTFTEDYDGAAYEDQYRKALDDLTAQGVAVIRDAGTDAEAAPVLVDDDALIAQLTALSKAKSA